MITIVCLNFVIASPSTIRILGFNYEQIEGKPSMVITSDTTKLGYYPDYYFQPEKGYNLQIQDELSQELFSLKFKSPDLIFYDEFKDTNITGGLVLINQTDFALTLPTFQNEDKIVILDEDNSEVLSYVLPKEKQEQTTNYLQYWKWVFLICALTIIFLLARKINKKRIQQ